MGKEWDKIKATLKGYKLPVKNQKPTNSELANLKTIFQKLGIKKIIFENGKYAFHPPDSIFAGNIIIFKFEYERHNIFN